MTQKHLFTGATMPPEGAQDEFEAHYTPGPLAWRLVGYSLQQWGMPAPGETILEPHVGGGAFARALKQAHLEGVQVVGCDIDPRVAGFTWCDERHVGNFLDWTPDFAPWAVLGNPPFSDAEAHIRHALQVCAEGGHVGMLLPLDHLGSEGREALWHDWRPYRVTVLVPRPFPANVRDCVWVEWWKGVDTAHFSGSWLRWR